MGLFLQCKPSIQSQNLPGDKSSFFRTEEEDRIYQVGRIADATEWMGLMAEFR